MLGNWDTSWSGSIVLIKPAAETQKTHGLFATGCPYCCDSESLAIVSVTTPFIYYHLAIEGERKSSRSPDLRFREQLPPVWSTWKGSLLGSDRFGSGPRVHVFQQPSALHGFWFLSPFWLKRNWRQMFCRPCFLFPKSMIIALLQGLPPKTTSKRIVLACWKCTFGIGVGRMHVENACWKCMSANACWSFLGKTCLGPLVTKAQSRQQALASAHASTHAFWVLEGEPQNLSKT